MSLTNEYYIKGISKIHKVSQWGTVTRFVKIWFAQNILGKHFFFKTLIIIIIFYYYYFWLCWVFVSVRGLSLLVASGFVAVRGPLIAVASPVVEHGL